MIERYRHEEMHAVWTEEAKIASWLRVERAVLNAQTALGIVPSKEGRTLADRLLRYEKTGAIKPKRIEEIEKRTKHDVLAFTEAVSEKSGAAGRWLHFGLTSSDVVDTALSLRIQIAGEVLLPELDGLVNAARALAKKYRDLPAIGRTHGMFAEPTSFGLRFLGFAEAFTRDIGRIEVALEELRVGKLSGAVGVNAHFPPSLEAKILKELALEREPVSTQVLPRDRHAELFSSLAILGANIERAATELRHLQRSEVGEVREGFSKGQKGSSAMPHKRNPISSENLTGCARLLRGYALASWESVALWHERDISHSSVERVAFPDAFELSHYMVKRLRQVFEQLEVDRKRIAENLQQAGDASFSGHVLIRLVEKGVAREKAYAWVQECALKGTSGKFVERALAHSGIRKHLAEKELREITDVKHALRNVAAIYSSL